METNFQKEMNNALDELRAEFEKKSIDQGKIANLEKTLTGLEEKNQELVKVIAQNKAKEQDFEKSLEGMEKLLKHKSEGFIKDETFELEKKAFERFVKDGKDKTPIEELKYLRTDNNERGGYLVPVDYRNEIIKDLVEITPFRSVARTTMTARNEVEFQKRTNTPTAYWVGQGASTTESQSKYGAEKIPVHKLTAEIIITSESLSDSAFNMESEIMSDATEQFAKAEGIAFISGDSVNKPEGVLTNASVGEIISGHATSLVGDAFFSIQGEFKTGYVNTNNLTWMFSANTLYKHIRTLKDGVGNYILQAGLAGGIPNTVAGRPYIFAPDMPNVSAGLYPVVIGDYRQAYYIVDRLDITMIRDQFVLASYDKVRFIMKRRVGGQVVKPEAMKKMKVSAS